MVEHIRNLVETLQQPKLHSCVLFRLGEVASANGRPVIESLRREEDADGEGCLAVGGYVEDVFRGGSLWIVRQSRALAHKVVLINEARLGGVGLERRMDMRSTSVGRSRRIAAEVSELTGE